MNKSVERLKVDLEAYLAETDLISVEALTNSILRTLYLIETYKALFEIEEE